MTDLTDKLAVLTGISGNLGPIWSDILREHGAQLFPIDLPITDITDKEAVQIAQKICFERYGMPNILICNAAIDNVPGNLSNSIFDNWDRIIDVNLTGTKNVIEAFIGNMTYNKPPSNIIVIGSIFGNVAADYRNYDEGDKPAAYGAAKAGLMNLVKNIAVRYAYKGVLCNMLSFSAFDSGQHEPEFQKRFLSNVPIGRMWIKEDVINIFLAMATNTYMTGQQVLIDGGYVLLP